MVFNRFSAFCFTIRDGFWLFFVVRLGLRVILAFFVVAGEQNHGERRVSPIPKHELTPIAFRLQQDEPE